MSINDVSGKRRGQRDGACLEEGNHDEAAVEDLLRVVRVHPVGTLLEVHLVEDVSEALARVVPCAHERLLRDIQRALDRARLARWGARLSALPPVLVERHEDEALDGLQRGDDRVPERERRGLDRNREARVRREQERERGCGACMGRAGVADGCAWGRCAAEHARGGRRRLGLRLEGGHAPRELAPEVLDDPD